MTTTSRLPRALIVVTAGLAIALGAPAAPALADQGDGLLSCNTGEICFKRDSGGGNSYLRHFWYDDMWWTAGGGHGNEYFTDQGGVVLDRISSEFNRDTECDVYLEDIDGGGHWHDYYTMESRQSGGYYYVGSSKNDRNNGHVRCTPYDS